MKKFPWWPYIKLELEVDGVIVDARYIQNKDYEKVMEFFRAVGKSQPNHWAIFAKRHIAKKSLYQRVRRRRKENEKRRSKKSKTNKHYGY